MSGNDKRPLVPRLRFPDFDKPWSNDPLSKTLVEHKLKNTDGRDVFSVSMESGIVNQIEHLGRSFAASDTANYNLCRRFDVVYTKSPLKAFPFGIVKQCKFDGEVALSPLYGVFTPENPQVGLMIEAYFESPNRSRAFLSPLCQKGAKNTIQITNTAFLSGRLPLPTEPAEQQKIADCLQSLDELIKAENQKLDALKTHKKGLMQQLFPREGETVPLLRFPEFQEAGEWEENQLGDLVEIRSGYSPSQYQLTGDGAYPFVKVEDLNNCTKYQEKAREYSSDTYGLIPCNSVIFPKRGAAIALNKIRLSRSELLMDTNMMALTPLAQCSVDFLFYHLSNVGLSQVADNSTIPQINNKHIIPFHISIPPLEEQRRISDCLSALDESITNQTLKIETIQAHKKGLMQQLFPVLDEVLV
jgi:type I restriction enzyme S subunit